MQDGDEGSADGAVLAGGGCGQVLAQCRAVREAVQAVVDAVMAARAVRAPANQADGVGQPNGRGFAGVAFFVGFDADVVNAAACAFIARARGVGVKFCGGAGAYRLRSVFSLLISFLNSLFSLVSI